MMTPLCFVLTEARNVKREPRPLGGGISLILSKGKIVDTILRINRTLLKTGKHAFFLFFK